MCDSINCFKQRNDMRLKSENVLTIYGILVMHYNPTSEIVTSIINLIGLRTASCE